MKESFTLFISIASYRDPELIPTLTDILATAEHPQNLRIAICWQHGDESSALFTDAGMTLLEERQCEGYRLLRFHWQQALLDILAVHYRHSQGACWARYMAETRFANEDFFLQIDSHCRFIRHWDSEMITMLDGLRNRSDKPVLSTYPPAYEPQDYPANRGSFVSRLVFREFSREGLPMLSSVPLKSEQPVRGSYLAGGFIFADGHFACAAANDPQIFFAGEEIAMAARAWSHGYDVYTPHKCLLWHFYGRKNENKVWSDLTREAKAAGDISMAWWERDGISKKRIRSLLGLESTGEDLGRYGLGSLRSLRDFERFIGVDFAKRAVLPKVVGHEKISVFEPENWPDEAQWAQLLISPHQKNITFKKEPVLALMNAASWVHLGVYSAANRLIDLKKLTPEQLQRSIEAAQGDEFTLQIQFSSSPGHMPAVVRLCPFNDSTGWESVVEKAW
jgi:hypothetical protein